MAQVSKFSTQENYTHIQNAMAQLDEAIHEAKLAVRAGIPDAQNQLDQAEAARKQLTTLMDVYFPGGTAPAG